jgi:hypothetical protein
MNMKAKSIKLLVVGFLISLLHTQTFCDTSSYLPLQVGNTWKYLHQYYKNDEDYWNDMLTDDPHLVTIRISGTIEMNGKTYYMIQREENYEMHNFELTGGLYRTDGSYIYKYDPQKVSLEGIVFDVRPCGEVECDSNQLFNSRNDYISWLIPRVTVTKDLPIGALNGYSFLISDVVYSESYFLSPELGLSYFADSVDFISLSIGRYSLVYALIDGVEYGNIGVKENTPSPYTITLLPNSPNPFNPSTTITFSLPSNGFTSLVIYNIMGQKVRNLLMETKKAGTHSIIWDGRDENGMTVSSGIYISKLLQGKHTATGKMMVVR